MDPNSEELTRFRTRYGAYKYKVLQIGLISGPTSYQRYINNVLFKCLDVFSTANLDDILIYSDDIKAHKTHFKLVLQRQHNADLEVYIQKCEFNVTKTKYLGFIIRTDGIHDDLDYIGVVKDWEPPTNERAVQSFLEFCNFYRQFIRDCGIITKPLNQLNHENKEF